MNESHRRLHLQRMADHGDRFFNPAMGMLRLAMPVHRNVHSEHLDDSPRHPVHGSLIYALVLLEMADRALQGRAEAILSRVIDLQETSDPQAKTFGLWPYFLEEPVPVWPWPDFNGADFNGTTLLLIWHRHRRRLAPALLGKLVEAIRRAAVCIRRRNVDLNYTNIAIKGTFVTLSTAEVTGDAELLAYALDRLERLSATVATTGAFAEYNSPTYAAISLAGLHAMETYVRDERARPLVTSLLTRFWRDVAERFHPETRELAGPHARAYMPSLSSAPELLGSLIEKASRGAVHYALTSGREEFGAIYACVMNVEPPAGIAALLAARSTEPRQVTARAQARTTEAPRVQTTWLEPAFCLGSVSFQDGWEQRHNLIAYWKSSDGGTGLMRHRYLRDERPCCSGWFTSQQEGGAVAVGAFLGAYADHYVSVLTDGTTCAFLGPVIEIDTAGEEADVRVEGRRVPLNTTMMLSVGDVVHITLGVVTLEIVLTRHDIVPVPDTGPRLERMKTGALRIVLPHYEGKRRALKWADFERAVSTYTLRMAAAGAEFPSVADLSAPVPEATPHSQAATEAWGREQQTLTV